MSHPVYASKTGMNLGASIWGSSETSDLVRRGQAALDLVNRLAVVGSYPARLWIAFTTPLPHQHRSPAEIHYLDQAARTRSRSA
jgi:hypothetical protein